MNINLWFRRLIIGALSVSITVSSIGCSCFQPKLQSVTIESLPTGALIKVDGQEYGTAPVTVQLDRDKDHSIIGVYGSKSDVRELNSKFSKTGILDVIGTVLFLFPGIGLFTPGAWELDSTRVVLQTK